MRVWWVAVAMGLGLALAVGVGGARADDHRLRGAIDAMAAGDVVVLMRHAQTTPGVGDPDGFDLARRETQRNLNALGEAQARRFGKAVRAASVEIGAALVSEWARAADTARLILEAAERPDMAIETFPPLNNVWDGDPTAGGFVAEARAAIADWRGPGVLLMVSHGVTIRPIAGRRVPQGGFLVLEPTQDGGFEIIAEGAL